MSRVHMEYEMLCAFAAVGQLSEAELNDLSEHVESCSSCHRRLAEMETASYTYFLRHAGKAKGVDTPAGFQQRFEERAGSMGIPLRDITAALPGTRFISLALSVVLLTVAAQVGWKILYPQVGERTAVHVETSSIAPLQRVIGDAPIHGDSPGGLSGGRNTTRFRNAGSYTSPHRETRKVQSYSNLSGSPPLRLRGSETFAGDHPLSTPEVVREYLTSGLQLPERRTFELTAAPRFLAGGEYSIPDKHAFRYNPTFASLSFLGVPERVELPRFPAMSEPPPLFRINSTKTW